MPTDHYGHKFLDLGIILTEDGVRALVGSDSELVVISHQTTDVGVGGTIRGLWTIECSIQVDDEPKIWVPIAMVAKEKPKYYKTAFGLVSFFKRLGLSVVHMPLEPGITSHPVSLKNSSLG